jgi:hypothetical protein
MSSLNYCEIGRNIRQLADSGDHAFGGFAVAKAGIQNKQESGLWRTPERRA